MLKALEVSVAVLERQDAQAADRYRELAVFPSDEAIPEAAIVTLWEHTGAISPRKVRKLLSALASKGLLQQAIPQNVPWLCPQQANLTPPDGPLLRTLAGHSTSVLSVAILPAREASPEEVGPRAVSASDDQTFKVWDLATGRCIATFWGDHPFLTCAIAPDGVTLVAGDQAGVVHFFRLEGVGGGRW